MTSVAPFRRRFKDGRQFELQFVQTHELVSHNRIHDANFSPIRPEQNRSGKPVRRIEEPFTRDLHTIVRKELSCSQRENDSTIAMHMKPRIPPLIEYALLGVGTLITIYVLAYLLVARRVILTSRSLWSTGYPAGARYVAHFPNYRGLPWQLFSFVHGLDREYVRHHWWTEAWYPPGLAPGLWREIRLLDEIRFDALYRWCLSVHRLQCEPLGCTGTVRPRHLVAPVRMSLGEAPRIRHEGILVCTPESLTNRIIAALRQQLTHTTSVRQAVGILGPGYIPPGNGTGSIQWFFDDGVGLETGLWPLSFDAPFRAKTTKIPGVLHNH